METWACDTHLLELGRAGSSILPSARSFSTAEWVRSRDGGCRPSNEFGVSFMKRRSCTPRPRRSHSKPIVARRSRRCWVASRTTSTSFWPPQLLLAAAQYPQFAPRYPYGRSHVTDNVYRTLGLPSPHIFLEAPYFYSGAQVVMSSYL